MTSSPAIPVHLLERRIVSALKHQQFVHSKKVKLPLPAPCETIRHNGHLHEIERLKYHRYSGVDKGVILRHNQKGRVRRGEDFLEPPCFVLTLYMCVDGYTKIEICTLYYLILNDELLHSVQLGSGQTFLQSSASALEALALMQDFLKTVHAFVHNEPC